MERARIIQTSSDGESVADIATRLQLKEAKVRKWIKRFNQEGLPGLEDVPRAGRPATYTPEEVSEVIATALTDPQTLGLPFASWTLDRLEAYLNQVKGIGMKRSRIDDVLLQEGLRWHSQERWFGERVDPDLARKKGGIEQLDTQPPANSRVVCLDEMGPENAKSYPGQQIVPATQRAKQELDYGRRGKGYIFGAFHPVSGDAFAESYRGRTTVNWVDFLEQVEAWIPPEIEHVYAIVDNLSTHRATDVLLFSLAHPRWELVFQPKYAAYLNLIEPWWKVLRSLALKERRFESWEQVCQAVEAATAYSSAHRHPFIWGKRRRHRSRRQPGFATLPNVA